jgi:hypothetical protein
MLKYSIIPLAFALSACSTVNAERVSPWSVSVKQEELRRSVKTKKDHFVDLVTLVQNNWEITSSKESFILAKVAKSLALDAGLSRECKYNRCYMVYKDKKIVIDKSFVTITNPDSSYVKTDSAVKAANLIY